MNHDTDTPTGGDTDTPVDTPVRIDASAGIKDPENASACIAPEIVEPALDTDTLTPPLSLEKDPSFSNKTASGDAGIPEKTPAESKNDPELAPPAINDPDPFLLRTYEHDPVFRDHVTRLQSAVLSGHTLETVPRWIVENTKLKGDPFSFKDHEFQEYIAHSKARTRYVRKCAQVGISEFSARETLAFLNIIDSVTAIYTLPTADFAKNFAATRIGTIVSGSDQLKRALNPAVDNTQVKQFNDSFMYIKGTVGTNAAISVPADLLVHDEYDFSDPTVVSNYQSRVQHSKWKLRRYFSTPTVEGFGISAGFDKSRRHWNFVKCNHCNHQFIPSYFKHVRIPDYDGDIREITGRNLHNVDYKAAWLECPSCGKEPSLQPEHREWVLENPLDNHDADGYQIQPFDAPNVITLADLILSSTTYKRYGDFINFALGLPAEDKESCLTREELEKCFVTGEAPTSLTTVMGIDMGMVCHVWVGAVDYMGDLLIIHTEQVPVHLIRKRKAELAAQFRVAITVMDSLPYTETVIALQETDVNLYGAVYVQSKDLKAWTMKKESKKKGDEDDDQDEAEASVQVRQVNINKNFAFDEFMAFVRADRLKLLKDDNEQTIISHLTDMKRVRKFGDAELGFVWQKSAGGDDHFHHAGLYCYIAAQMRGATQRIIVLPNPISTFKVKI